MYFSNDHFVQFKSVETLCYYIIKEIPVRGEKDGFSICYEISDSVPQESTGEWIHS